eukprot:6479155-Amphidinium_carterae.4
MARTARSASPTTARSSHSTQNADSHPGEAGGVCASPSTKDIEQARKWLASLSIGKALAGKRVNNDIYQAERSQKSVEGTPEDVLLNAKLTAVKAAAQVHAEVIGKLPTAERNKKLGEVFDDMAMVDEVPPSFKQALLVCRARDLRPSTIEQVTTWVDHVKVVPAGAILSKAHDVMEATMVRT